MLVAGTASVQRMMGGWGVPLWGQGGVSVAAHEKQRNPKENSLGGKWTVCVCVHGAGEGDRCCNKAAHSVGGGHSYHTHAVLMVGIQCSQRHEGCGNGDCQTGDGWRGGGVMGGEGYFFDGWR